MHTVYTAVVLLIALFFSPVDRVQETPSLDELIRRAEQSIKRAEQALGKDQVEELMRRARENSSRDFFLKPMELPPVPKITIPEPPVKVPRQKNKESGKISSFYFPDQNFVVVIGKAGDTLGVKARPEIISYFRAQADAQELSYVPGRWNLWLTFWSHNGTLFVDQWGGSGLHRTSHFYYRPPAPMLNSRDLSGFFQKEILRPIVKGIFH